MVSPAGAPDAAALEIEVVLADLGVGACAAAAGDFCAALTDADELAGGADGLAAETDELAGGADGLAAETDELAAGADDFAADTDEFAGGTDEPAAE